MLSPTSAWLLLALLSVTCVPLVSSLASQYGGFATEGAAFGGNYGGIAGSQYDNVAGAAANGAAVGAANYNLAGAGVSKTAQKSCESYVCLEWVSVDQAHIKSEEGITFGEGTTLLGASRGQGYMSGQSSFGSNAASQNFLDTYGWGPLVSQSAYGYAQGSGVFNNAFGQVQFTAGESKIAGSNAASAAFGHVGQDHGMRCNAYRCVTKAEMEAAKQLGPNFGVGYTGASSNARVGDMTGVGYGGVSALGAYGGFGGATGLW
eukprot:TRINITY_DN12597_c0_g1_i1.p1 TRINITY_DN12597_c0_g1~~TRINITY_DN12597_c0_g1_i1.p1  ORF type:complete len:262 (+),score=-14.86 TRINITY_DN12597_c0_g1_i1:63-848(+)